MIHTEKGDYELKYTYNALCEYEEKYGRPFLADLNKTGFAVLRGLLWTGLLHVKKPAFTERQVGGLMEEAIENGADLIDMRNEIVKAVQEANFIQRLVALTEQRMASQKAQENKQEK